MRANRRGTGGQSRASTPPPTSEGPPPIGYPERESTLRLRNFLLRSIEKADADDTISVPEARLLVLLVELSKLGIEPLPQVRLARILGVAEPTLTAVVRDLKRNHLIEETQSELEPDGRHNRLAITEEGQKALADFEDRYLAFPESALLDARRLPAFEAVILPVETEVSRLLEQRLRILSSNNYHSVVSFIENRIANQSSKITKEDKNALLRQAYQALAEADAHRLDEREALTRAKRQVLATWPKPPNP